MKDAAQPDRVEGFPRAPHLIRLMPGHVAELYGSSKRLFTTTVEEGINPNPPCQHSMWEKT
jgi:hypothetical protein